MRDVLGRLGVEPLEQITWMMERADADGSGGIDYKVYLLDLAFVRCRGWWGH